MHVDVRRRRRKSEQFNKKYDFKVDICRIFKSVEEQNDWFKSDFVDLRKGDAMDLPVEDFKRAIIFSCIGGQDTSILMEFQQWHGGLLRALAMQRIEKVGSALVLECEQSITPRGWHFRGPFLLTEGISQGFCSAKL